MSSGQRDVPDPALVESRIESQRRRLQKASAILVCVDAAVERGVDIEVLGDAVAAGRELVDAAIVALDSVSLAEDAARRPGEDSQATPGQ